MKTDLLADRHIGIQEEDLPVMLEKIGVKSLDELINKTIPSKIRLKEPLPLAAPMTEREFANILIEKASYVLYMIHDLKFVMLKKVTNFLEIKFHIMNISN